MENRTDTEELQSNQETDKLECMLCEDHCTVKDSLDTIFAEKRRTLGQIFTVEGP